MLIDEAEVILKAGHGGPGRVSFYKVWMKGPDGGNGGKGGDVYLKATSDLMALRQFTSKKILAAENGEMGGKNKSSGKDGKDIEVLMPVGTVLEDIRTGEVIELIEPDQRILICKGGLGGKGNTEFKSSRNTTPEYAQPGLPGEEKEFKIHLKLIADFGLIGLPNAGKSSLLNELTTANVKTADYPFTTLEPNLGSIKLNVISTSDGEEKSLTSNDKISHFVRGDKKRSLILADIPGLIEGASIGKGLGIKFLKHIEKVSILLHCIAADSEDLLGDYKTVWKELENYSESFKKKPEIILLTKSDLVTKEKLKEQLKLLKPLKKEVVPISIHDWDSLENLRNILSKSTGQRL